MDGPRRERQWGIGLFIGGVAYVLGFCAMALLVFYEDNEAWMADVDAGAVSMVDVVAVVFYNAQFVPYSVDMAGFGGGINVLTSNPPTLPTWWFHALPVAVIVAVAAVAAYRQLPPRVAPSEGFHYGASAIYGYAVASVVGSFVFTIEFGGAFVSGSVSPDIWMTLLMMGLIIPGVAGGFGGWLGQAINHRLNAATTIR